MLSLIVSGDLASKDRIPSERELQDIFNVSRMTVRRALNELAEEGYLYREQGRGSFVARPRMEHQLGRLTSFTEDMQLRHLPSDSTIAHCCVVQDAEVTRRMGISSEEELVRLDRVRSIAGEPSALQAAYIRHALVPGFTARTLVDGSLYRTLEAVYGLQIGHAEQTIEAKPADEYEAEKLQIQRLAPILALERLTFLHDGEPIEFVRSSYRGDKYRFVVALKR